MDAHGYIYLSLHPPAVFAVFSIHLPLREERIEKNTFLLFLKMAANKHGQPYCKACQFYTHPLDDNGTYYLCFCFCFALFFFLAWFSWGYRGVLVFDFSDSTWCYGHPFPFAFLRFTESLMVDRPFFLLTCLFSLVFLRTSVWHQFDTDIAGQGQDCFFNFNVSWCFEWNMCMWMVRMERMTTFGSCLQISGFFVFCFLKYLYCILMIQTSKYTSN